MLRNKIVETHTVEDGYTILSDSIEISNAFAIGVQVNLLDNLDFTGNGYLESTLDGSNYFPCETLTKDGYILYAQTDDKLVVATQARVRLEVTSASGEVEIILASRGG